jgi:hypothetical protein
MSEEHNTSGKESEDGSQKSAPKTSDFEENKNDRPASKDQQPGSDLSADKSETSSRSQPQPEIMEVHKHPHHVTHKKKWPEYFLEFLMIFLAVFLGFLAENWREYAGDRRKEKQYMSSLFEDLKHDTARIHFHIRTRLEKGRMMDSLADLLMSQKQTETGNDIYYFARFVTRSFPLIGDNGTLQQLKNSDGLRLIRKQEVVDSILRYDGAIRYIQDLDEREMFPIEKTFREIAGEAFDSRSFKFRYEDLHKRPVEKPQLITTDLTVMNKIALQVRFESRVIERSVQNFQYLDRGAVKLMELLRKEYHLK